MVAQSDEHQHQTEHGEQPERSVPPELGVVNLAVFEQLGEQVAAEGHEQRDTSVSFRERTQWQLRGR